MKILNFVFLAMLIFTTGCLSKATETDNVTAGTTSDDTDDDDDDAAAALTIAELAGSYQSDCVPTAGMGTVFNGTSYLSILTINANTQYAWNTIVFTGPTCGVGGYDILSYLSYGNVATDGLATTPAGGTKLIFTQSQVYSKIEQSADEATWKTFLDTACAANYDIATNALLDMDGMGCTGPTITSQIFGTSGNEFFNVVDLNGSIISIALPAVFIHPGNYTTYPTAFGMDLEL